MDDCVGGESAGNPGLEPPVVVYPNPTNGPFTVGLNEVVDLARMSLYTIDGGHLVSTEQTSVYELNYDITDFVPGSYLLQVYIRRADESEATHSFTLIKYSE